MGTPVINFAAVLFITQQLSCASWQAPPPGAQCERLGWKDVGAWKRHVFDFWGSFELTQRGCRVMMGAQEQTSSAFMVPQIRVHFC